MTRPLLRRVLRIEQQVNRPPEEACLYPVVAYHVHPDGVPSPDLPVCTCRACRAGRVSHIVVTPPELG